MAKIQVLKQPERKSVVIVAPYAGATKNYHKFTDSSGKFPQSYYVPLDTWDKVPASIRITIEPQG